MLLKKKIVAAAAIVILSVLPAQTVESYGMQATESVQAADSQLAEESYERVIAHGGGAYKGYETTNSVEALNSSIASGYKIIELDMELSSDGKIIMLHDWDRTAKDYYGAVFPKKLSQSQFMQLSVYGKFEVLTFDKLAAILKEHPDVRIVTDCKGDNLSLLALIAEQYPDFGSRFIPQIYDFDQWDKVRELGYKDIILTLYAMADPDPDQILAFVKDHETYAVTMPDYIAVRGICKTLSDQGVVVYVHPVSEYEDARKFMGQGAYGVYTGSLLPEEFAGVEKDYYLTAPGPGGSVIKLTDSRIGDWTELSLHGQKPGDTVLYFLDGSVKNAEGSDFSDLAPGKHKLTVKITNGKETLGTLNYFLWKDSGSLRAVHKKYEYRIDGIKQEKGLQAAMEEAHISGQVKEILENSLIAKARDSSYYSNGILKTYMNGEELLPVQLAGWRPLLPLADTARELGASSVTMGEAKDLTVVYNAEKIKVIANSAAVRKGFQVTWLNDPVTVYLDKAMAGGEFYRYMTGRNYYVEDERIIILPAGVDPDKDMKRQLTDFIEKLF